MCYSDSYYQLMARQKLHQTKSHAQTDDRVKASSPVPESDDAKSVESTKQPLRQRELTTVGG